MTQSAIITISNMISNADTISIIGIIVGIIGTIIAIIIPLIGFLYNKKKSIKTTYNVIWKKSSKLKSEDILEGRPFHEYYHPCKGEDNKITQFLTEKQNTLIIGHPLAGKTRSLYQELTNLKKTYDVLIPRCDDIKIESFVIPKHLNLWRRKRKLVILDDLQIFAEKENFDYLLNACLKKKITIVATCQSGLEYKNVKNKLLEKNIYLETIFGTNIVEQSEIDEKTGKDIAAKVGIDWKDIKFNGAIGSIFISLAQMEKRFGDCTKTEKIILRAIKKLYIPHIYEEKQNYPLNWVKTVTKTDGVNENDPEWIDWLKDLNDKEFIKRKDNNIWIEETYLENIIDIEPSDISVFYEMISTFPKAPDVLEKIGNRAYEIGLIKLEKAEYMKIAIKSCEKALKIRTFERFPMDYAMTQNNLGFAYLRLAEVEEKPENCKKAIRAYEEALKIRTFERFPVDYAMTQNNLGLAYWTLAEVEEKPENCKKAIRACEEALKVRTLERFPMDYATTRNNLGNAYTTLAEVEGKAENCKKAIRAYEEALKIRTFERFPMQYAMAQNNLGTAYTTLAQVEGKAENCKKAIRAYEEALKVRTFEHFPMDYAMTQNNLGTAYGMLAEVEEKHKNCKKAIRAYEEALKVNTFERFPMQYAMAQNNLGLAYKTLAKVEEKAENCKKAIRACEEALKIRTFERFPMDYAMSRNNLGNAYQTLAEVEEKHKNCKKAIRAYEEALKVNTFERFPMDYAMAQNNLGLAYWTLAEVEGKAENCKKAIRAYEEALKVRTFEHFPMDYAMTQNNLGAAYQTLAQVEEKPENCKKAIQSFESTES